MNLGLEGFDIGSRGQRNTSAKKEGRLQCNRQDMNWHGFGSLDPNNTKSMGHHAGRRKPESVTDSINPTGVRSTCQQPAKKEAL